MKYVRYKNNRFCKIIIFIFIVVFGFSILVFKSDNKVKAGVIIDTTYTIDHDMTSNNYYNIIDLDKVSYFALREVSSNYNFEIAYIIDANNSVVYTLFLKGYDGATMGISRFAISFSRAASTPAISITYYACSIVENNGSQYILFDFSNLYNQVITANPNMTGAKIRAFKDMATFWEPINTISSIDNIYDVPQNSVVLLYLEDISGLNTTDYNDEITINWGFIDDNDDQLFSIYAPKITAFHDTEDEEIGIGLPQNAGGSATTYKAMKHNTLLSLYDSTYEATANIYAIYIHLTETTITWGFVGFDCTQQPPTPTAQSMQYITDSEQVYTYTANNSTQMTCRLSVSSNFNYITILNQSVFNIGYINPVLRSGGFFPAWSCYNWARGQTTGYATGYNAGQLPYQEGGTGYQAIYQAGYLKGQEDSIDTSFLVSLFDSVDSLFSIHIFPFLTIGEIVGIPFVISVVWFIIKQLRGGGGAD